MKLEHHKPSGAIWTTVVLLCATRSAGEDRFFAGPEPFALEDGIS